MIELSLGEIAEATHGQVHPPQAADTSQGEETMNVTDTRITATVVTDSREAQAGSLYVARRGEHADGHAYVAAAAANGAVAALTERVVDGLPCVVVTDTTDGFAALGREVVDRCTAAGGLQIVGITGSSGKTSTKDLAAQIGPQYEREVIHRDHLSLL